MFFAGFTSILITLVPPSWSEVAPILAKNCTPCHAGNGSGAYPLASASELRRRRSTVAEVLADHSMPPWLPTNPAGSFLHELRIDAADRALLRAWVDAGCVAPLDAEPTTRASSTLVEPSIASIAFAEGWSAAPEERDAMRSFAVRLGNTAALRISALRAHFVNPGHVGHVTFAADNNGEAERLDALDGADGFKLAGDIGDVSSGSLLGVGADGVFALPDGYAVEVKPNATVVAEVHASGRGKIENAGFTLELFAAKPDAMLLTALPVGSHGATRQSSSSEATVRTMSPALQQTYDIVAVIARPGRLARALKLSVESTANDRSHELLTIPIYNGHRDRPYAFAKPVRATAGSRLLLETTFETALAATQSTPECVLLVRVVDSPKTATIEVAESANAASTPRAKSAALAISTAVLTPSLRVMTHEVDAQLYEALLGRSAVSRTGSVVSAGATFFDALLWCNAASESLSKHPCYQLTHIERDGSGAATSAVVTMLDGDGFRLPSTAEWTALAALEDVVDAAGSLWEWCEDARGEARVVRGGSWADPEAQRKVETSATVPPSVLNELFGFRAVIGARIR